MHLYFDNSGMSKTLNSYSNHDDSMIQGLISVAGESANNLNPYK